MSASPVPLAVRSANGPALPDSAAVEQGATGSVPTALAPLHLRLFALLFDYAIVVSGVKLAQQVLLGEHWDLHPLPAQQGWMAFLNPWQGAMLALMLLRDAPGNSVGKWLTDLTIRRADHPDLRPALWRRVLRNLSLIVFPVDVWLVFRDPFGRRWGERWAGTVVVTRPKARDLYQRAMGLGVLFLGFILGALLVTSWNLRRSAAFQTAYATAQADTKAQDRLGMPLLVDRSPDLELHIPGPNQPEAPGNAIATFDVKGPKGTAKLRVDLNLLPASAGEPPHWSVATTHLQDEVGGSLQQAPAPNPAK
jgi:RDD family/Cytochrome oxidase complex assembly protein 1